MRRANEYLCAPGEVLERQRLYLAADDAQFPRIIGEFDASGVHEVDDGSGHQVVFFWRYFFVDGGDEIIQGSMDGTGGGAGVS